MIFTPGPHSWHGFDKRPIIGVRRLMEVNYVRPTWRDREQLCLPDRPVYDCLTGLRQAVSRGMRGRNRVAILAAAAIAAGLAAYFGVTRINLNPGRQVGEIIDRLDGVEVYFNGGVSHSGERNLATDGYNLGIKYQCVEFVKRYYYRHFNHRMPNAYGHAADFFDATLGDGEVNKRAACSSSGTEAPRRRRRETYWFSAGGS